MKKNKRILAMFLTILIVITSLPIDVMAENSIEGADVVEVTNDGTAGNSDASDSTENIDISDSTENIDINDGTEDIDTNDGTEGSDTTNDDSNKTDNVDSIIAELIEHIEKLDKEGTFENLVSGGSEDLKLEVINATFTKETKDKQEEVDKELKKINKEYALSVGKIEKKDNKYFVVIEVKNKSDFKETYEFTNVSFDSVEIKTIDINYNDITQDTGGAIDSKNINRNYPITLDKNKLNSNNIKGLIEYKIDGEKKFIIEKEFILDDYKYTLKNININNKEYQINSGINDFLVPHTSTISYADISAFNLNYSKEKIKKNYEIDLNFNFEDTKHKDQNSNKLIKIKFALEEELNEDINISFNKKDNSDEYEIVVKKGEEIINKTKKLEIPEGYKFEKDFELEDITIKNGDFITNEDGNEYSYIASKDINIDIEPGVIDSQGFTINFVNPYNGNTGENGNKEIIKYRIEAREDSGEIKFYLKKSESEEIDITKDIDFKFTNRNDDNKDEKLLYYNDKINIKLEKIDLKNIKELEENYEIISYPSEKEYSIKGKDIKLEDINFDFKRKKYKVEFKHGEGSIKEDFYLLMPETKTIKINANDEIKEVTVNGDNMTGKDITIDDNTTIVVELKNERNEEFIEKNLISEYEVSNFYKSVKGEETKMYSSRKFEGIIGSEFEVQVIPQLDYEFEDKATESANIFIYYNGLKSLSDVDRKLIKLEKEKNEFKFYFTDKDIIQYRIIHQTKGYGENKEPENPGDLDIDGEVGLSDEPYNIEIISKLDTQFADLKEKINIDLIEDERYKLIEVKEDDKQILKIGEKDEYGYTNIYLSTDVVDMDKVNEELNKIKEKQKKVNLIYQYDQLIENEKIETAQIAINIQGKEQVIELPRIVGDKDGSYKTYIPLDIFNFWTCFRRIDFSLPKNEGEFLESNGIKDVYFVDEGLDKIEDKRNLKWDDKIALEILNVEKPEEQSTFPHKEDSTENDENKEESIETLQYRISTKEDRDLIQADRNEDKVDKDGKNVPVIKINYSDPVGEQCVPSVPDIFLDVTINKVYLENEEIKVITTDKIKIIRGMDLPISISSISKNIPHEDKVYEYIPYKEGEDFTGLVDDNKKHIKGKENKYLTSEDITYLKIENQGMILNIPYTERKKPEIDEQNPVEYKIMYYYIDLFPGVDIPTFKVDKKGALLELNENGKGKEPLANYDSEILNEKYKAIIRGMNQYYERDNINKEYLTKYYNQEKEKSLTYLKKLIKNLSEYDSDNVDIDINEKIAEVQDKIAQIENNDFKEYILTEDLLDSWIAELTEETDKNISEINSKILSNKEGIEVIIKAFENKESIKGNLVKILEYLNNINPEEITSKIDIEQLKTNIDKYIEGLEKQIKLDNNNQFVFEELKVSKENLTKGLKEVLNQYFKDSNINIEINGNLEGSQLKKLGDYNINWDQSEYVNYKDKKTNGTKDQGTEGCIKEVKKYSIYERYSKTPFSISKYKWDELKGGIKQNERFTLLEPWIENDWKEKTFNNTWSNPLGDTSYGFEWKNDGYVRVEKDFEHDNIVPILFLKNKYKVYYDDIVDECDNGGGGNESKETELQIITRLFEKDDNKTPQEIVKENEPYFNNENTPQKIEKLKVGNRIAVYIPNYDSLEYVMIDGETIVGEKDPMFYITDELIDGENKVVLNFIGPKIPDFNPGEPESKFKPVYRKLIDNYDNQLEFEQYKNMVFPIDKTIEVEYKDLLDKGYILSEGEDKIKEITIKENQINTVIFKYNRIYNIHHKKVDTDEDVYNKQVNKMDITEDGKELESYKKQVSTNNYVKTTITPLIEKIKVKKVDDKKEDNINISQIQFIKDFFNEPEGKYEVIEGNKDGEQLVKDIKTEKIVAKVDGFDITFYYEVTKENLPKPPVEPEKPNTGGGSGGGGGGGSDRPKKPEKEEEPKKEEKLDRINHFEYIQGYPDNTIKAQNNITREEVAAVFYRLLEETYKSKIYTTKQGYKDFKEDKWSLKHVATLSNAKILTGYEDNTFRPGNNMTRAEVAAVASRFDNLSPSNHNFTDVKGHWAEKYIGSAAAKGWIKGYQDKTFRPDQPITRAEFVTLVNSVLDRKVEKENILEGIKEFKDLSEDKWYYEEFVEAINGHLYEKHDGKEIWLELKQFNKDM